MNDIEKMIEQAELGQIDAINYLALLYSDEHQPVFDLEQAMYYFNKGIEHGSGQAAYNLGIGYMNGQLGMDVNKAIDYFNLAITLDYTEGFYALGRIQSEEFDNTEKALDYWHQGFEYKDYQSALALASLAMEKEVPDTDEAIYYLMPFANEGHSEANYQLAVFYHEFLNDEEQALIYAKRAAEGGSYFAYLLLAYLKIDLKDLEAYEYLRKAEVLAKANYDYEFIETIKPEIIRIEASLDINQKKQINLILQEFIQGLMKKIN